MIRLRKSAITAFKRCPYYYLRMYHRNAYSFKPNVVMQVGDQFHHFAAEFFEALDFNELRKLIVLSQVESYFYTLIPAQLPPIVKPLCKNFVEFEAKHWIALQKQTRNPLSYFLPIATELELETAKLVPGVINNGHIDRMNRMLTDKRCIAEYKTGNPDMHTLRWELTYYELLAKACGIQCDYIAYYNPTNNDSFLEGITLKLEQKVRRDILEIVHAHGIKFFPRNPNILCGDCEVLRECIDYLGGDESG